MSKIRILPDQLANQIAAGEVVERPSSVVKELLENSLDAGATRIEIEIEGGGTRLIRIIDNGDGMDEDDILLCLERHGTSKIKDQNDLEAISTLGFRGEAVPSIGSVSQLSITSRQSGVALGTQVILHYGKLIKVHESGCSYGTRVEVRNLFGNTPARKKFLRTARTELGHIDEVVKNYALAAPAATLILRIDGRESLALEAEMTEEQRLAAIMRFDGNFIPVKDRNNGQTSLHGFLVPPEKVTIGPSRLRIFVNGRTIRDRMVTHAVIEGMRNFLMKGKNPSGLIHLRLPPGEVDVNVHPAKHEVRFRNSRDIHTLISSTVADSLLEYQKTIKTSIFGPGQRVDTTPIPVDTVNTDPPPLYNETSEEECEYDSSVLLPPSTKPLSGPINPRPATTPSIAPPQPLLKTAEPISRALPTDSTDSTDSTDKGYHTAPFSAPDKKVRHNLLVIGQFHNLYILCQSTEGLLVIDQHAAHERLLFEKLRRQLHKNSIARQTLMFPETVELSIFQTSLLEKNSEEISQLGFSIRDFGGSTFIIAAVPALAGRANARDLFFDVLEQFGSEKPQEEKGGLLDNILATMACKAAVKAGTELSLQEIDKLLNEMAAADLFSHCPHGRPVVKQFSRDEIKKWFYRT